MSPEERRRLEPFERREAGRIDQDLVDERDNLKAYGREDSDISQFQLAQFVPQTIKQFPQRVSLGPRIGDLLRIITLSPASFNAFANS